MGVLGWFRLAQPLKKMKHKKRPHTLSVAFTGLIMVCLIHGFNEGENIRCTNGVGNNKDDKNQHQQAQYTTSGR